MNIAGEWDLIFVTTPCIDKSVNTSEPTYYIKELYLAIIVTRIGINNTGEQLGSGYLLNIAHVLHDVDGDNAGERPADIIGLLANVILDTDCVKDGTFTRVNLMVGIDHLDEQADDGSLLSLIKINRWHLSIIYCPLFSSKGGGVMVTLLPSSA